MLGFFLSLKGYKSLFPEVIDFKKEREESEFPNEKVDEHGLFSRVTIMGSK